jgi:hypothetical protein
VEFTADHSASTPQHSNETDGRKSKDIMKAKFTEWGIDLKWVSLFPHIDDFNRRDPGQNFLGCVSRTVDDDTYPSVGVKYHHRKRLTLTFCQRKVNEDTEIREACVFNIHDGIRHWTRSLPLHHTDAGINNFVRSIHRAQTDELMYLATHENKCFYLFNFV